MFRLLVWLTLGSGVFLSGHDQAAAVPTGPDGSIGHETPTSSLTTARTRAPDSSAETTTLSVRVGTITGLVSDSRTLAPISNAQISIEGTQLGTLSNDRGRYLLLNVPAGEVTVVVQRIGYGESRSTVTLQDGETVALDFQLTPEALALGELVVTGFGSQSRESLTGSVGRVDRSNLEKISVVAVEDAIQGRASGVMVESGSGKLGQGIRVQVRGPASVSADNQPLYVIDGFPVTSESQSLGEATNPLADLNTNDIQSIDILKDASAAAIYGSRASNGVVLITTRSGSSGSPVFNLDYNVGWSEPSNEVDFLNAAEYRELYLEAAANAGRDENFLRDRVPFWDNPVPTDWQDAIWQDDAGAENLNLSVSGAAGNGDTRYFMSLGYTDQEGILIRNALERLNGRINLDQTVTDRITAGFNLSLARTINDRVSNDRSFVTPMQFVAQVPTSPVFIEDGEPNPNTLYTNGVTAALFDDSELKVFRNFGNVFAEIELHPTLSLRSEFGLDLLDQTEENFQSRRTSLAGAGTFRTVNVLNYNTNTFFTFIPTLPENHAIQAVAGSSFQRSRREISSVSGTDFPTDDFKRITSAANITDAITTGDGFTFLSYFARANYSYDNRYLFSVSGRADGSSRFGEENRWGFFPALSAGWVVSDEDFFTSDAIGFLKLRTSWGVTGNSEIGNFASRGLFVGADFVGQPGIRQTQLRNADLKWERTTQTDVGVDFSLFGGRIGGSLDYYLRKTKDLLLEVNVPGSSGFETVIQNTGKMRNRGFEALVNTQNLTKGRFSWESSFNISVNRNKVTDLAGQIVDTGAGSGDQRRPNVAMEGEPLGVFFAVKYAGVDPANGDALFFQRAGSDETTNDFGSAERQVIGDPNPDYQGGFTNTFTYGPVSLDGTFQFVRGKDAFAGAGIFYASNARFFDNQTSDQLRRWQQPGDVTDVPQARLGQNNGGQISSRYLFDASFIRLRSLNLAWDLPQEVTQRLGDISSARLYLRANNLWTITDYPLWDPDVNTSVIDNISVGNDFYTAPQARTFSVGFTLVF